MQQIISEGIRKLELLVIYQITLIGSKDVRENKYIEIYVSISSYNEIAL